MSESLGRRDLIKIAAGGAVARVARGAGHHKFFTDAEYRMVDELTELIIPQDEKSGGARAAKVAEYIDARLAEAFEQSERDEWRAGLKLVNSVSMEMNHRAFLDAPADGRLAVLTRLAQDETHSEHPEQRFFRVLKDHTTRAYYTSKIGIHDDMEYKGNVVQPGDYAGYLPDDPI